MPVVNYKQYCDMLDNAKKISLPMLQLMLLPCQLQTLLDVAL